MSEGADQVNLPALDFAAVIASGLVGQSLAVELADRFPKLGRADVFLGIAIAWTVREADMLLAQGEIRQLRKEIEQLRRAAA